MEELEVNSPTAYYSVKIYNCNVFVISRHVCVSKLNYKQQFELEQNGSSPEVVDGVERWHTGENRNPPLYSGIAYSLMLVVGIQ